MSPYFPEPAITTKRKKSGTAATKPRKAKKKSAQTDTLHVTASWLIHELVTHFPQATEVMAEWGLHCFGCQVGGLETLEEGCRIHGFSDEDIELIVADINETIGAVPPKPQMLSITKEAAEQIKVIAHEQHEDGKILSVQAEKDGSFFLEFRAEIEEGEKTFCNPEVPDVTIAANPLTLQRIGGSTIEYKDGRFGLATSVA